MTVKTDLQFLLGDMQRLLMISLSEMSIKQNVQGEWYLDLVAAAYVIWNAGKLRNLITHIENVHFPLSTFHLSLSNVIVDPNVKNNIISISKLVDDKNASIESTPC